jgi:NDP-sugar pyrophosphorylase family protein
MKAMILAAGFGTRLWPLTVGRTKPAIPFLNRPLIAYTIDYLRGFGVEDLIINLHHEPESVRAELGDGSQFGVHIHYSVEEPEILGNSGAVDKVRDLLIDETFLVVNGKIITDMDLAAAIDQHRRRRAPATMVLRPNSRRERFSKVIVDDEGRIVQFAGFPSPQDEGPAPLMFTGIHILEPEIFDYIPRGVVSDWVRDVYPRLIRDRNALAAYIAPAAPESNWYEMSTIERYFSISIEFLAREGRDLIVDEGSVIEPSAEVRRSILWKRARIGAGARLNECIVCDDATIPPHSTFSRSILFNAEKASLEQRPEKALPGTVVNGLLVVPFP